MNIEIAALFLFGLIFGSFLNVCVHRIPKHESVVLPGSKCPHCGRSIRPRHNIPVLSYALLRGRCATCSAKIGWQYPTGELVMGVLCALLFVKYGWTSPFFVNLAFFALLVILAFIDLFERILPDIITLRGAILGLVIAPFQDQAFVRPGISSSPVFDAYLGSLLGLVVGGGFLWIVAKLYLKIRKVEGMGLGDIKLMFLVGTFLGWKLTWLTILLGSLTGAVVGGLFIYMTRQGRRYELPFGTFLALGAICATLFGQDLLLWYRSLML